MLDNLYENIGGKIKNWAKWIFIIEAIGAIIMGLVLLFKDEDLILYGLLTLVCGPIVAWVGSWLLYAFGELVEDVHAIRNKEGITEEQANREAEEKATREAKEIAQKKAQIFSSPKCSNTVKTNEERWAQEIKTLSIEELKARSEDDYNWTEKYRELCHEELKNKTVT